MKKDVQVGGTELHNLREANRMSREYLDFVEHELESYKMSVRRHQEFCKKRMTIVKLGPHSTMKREATKSF
jgi:hypothetical protein